MRSTLQRLATAAAVAKPSASPAATAIKSTPYPAPGQPTGLTGLVTHPSPRSTLLYIYSTTLDRLQQVPAHSVYRTSVENITRHRLDIMEGIKPAGWDEWAARAQELVKKYPSQFRPVAPSSSQASLLGPASGSKASTAGADGDALNAVRFVEIHGSAKTAEEEALELDTLEWNGEKGQATLEGSRTPEEQRRNAMRAAVGGAGEDLVKAAQEGLRGPLKWEAEPQLTVEQVSEAEQKIGAGLIEEVIQVAEGELKLLNTMIESKPWDPLEEAPVPGQWDYAERDQHVKPTQAPPSASK